MSRSLGARLRALRQGRGWSQKELASRSGVSTRFLGQMESGVANVSVDRLAEVAAALDVSLVTLLAGEGPVHDAADVLAQHVLGLGAEAQSALVRRILPGSTRHLSLVGLRGAGKSTIGARVADALGVRFVVVDDEVRAHTGLALSDLFEMHGAAGYHRFCLEVLETVTGGMEPTVLEIGGSVVADPTCWALLDAHTRVVWLRASAEAHLTRVAAQGDTRPMEGFADAAARLREILAIREPLYQRAHVSIDTEAEGLEGAVEQVVDLVRDQAIHRVTPEDAAGP